MCSSELSRRPEQAFLNRNRFTGAAPAEQVSVYPNVCSALC